MPSMQPPRGTKDFLPEEMDRRQYILDVARTVFESFGFGPFDTPAFESWEILSRKGGGGEEIKDEIYHFKDKSGRELGLRFDLTVPLARVIAGNPQLQLPFKRYHIGKVWRYDRPQAGRMREFTQADADVIGPGGMDADAECLAAAVVILKALGFRSFDVRINNRKILDAMVDSVGVEQKRKNAVFRVLDKLEKVTRKEIVAGLKDAGMKPSGIEKLLDMTGIKGSPSGTLSRIKKLLGGFGKALEGIKELEEIVHLSHYYDFSDSLVVDLSLVRGLEYYTGPIFEVKIKKGESVGSVAGGGRYDNLIELYGGRPAPATGISFGIERIHEVMSREDMFDAESTPTRVFVVSIGEHMRDAAVEVAQILRKDGIKTETELSGRNVRKQLDYVNRKGIPHAVIVGPEELSAKKFKLRDMKTGRERKLKVEELSRSVKS